MTRFLSEALGAPEPLFRTGLRRLETAQGNPSHDIRLSTDVSLAAKGKLRELGLDPVDTTAEELYHVLNERIKADDQRLQRTLQTRAATHISAEADVVAGMAHALRDLPVSRSCFALKSSRMRALIKRQPPKKAMKQLGYRSLDSFLKHEKLAAVLAAAWLTESHSWQQQLIDQYKRLKPSDFENRPVTIVHPDSSRWRALAENVVSQRKHNLLSFKEFGSLVLLPLPKEVPNGATAASLTLALHELNQIRASSTFLKICQLRSDFGQLVQQVVNGEPSVSSELLDQPVPWHLLQRYYARLSQDFREELFGPHVSHDDLSWQSVEKALAQIEPSLAFWHGSAHLGLLHDHQPVSLNIVDAALNLCNHLPFERRLTQAFKRSLWHELLLRYLSRATVEQTVLRQLDPQAVAEVATS